jgi:hypothetical protein
MDQYYEVNYMTKANCEQLLVDQMQNQLFMYVVFGATIGIIILYLFYNTCKMEELESRIEKRELVYELRRDLIKHV